MRHPISLALLTLVVGAHPVFAQAVRTQVAEGQLAGTTQGNAAAFLGVPYAAPPVGELRWKPPQPLASWTGARPADHFAASCQQAVIPGGFGPWTQEYVVSGEVSEDCLYLNVWTAARTKEDRLPVLFWIHGGGFSQGSGSVPIYDGAALAAQGIVVVTINYRVGMYGFLAHPELTAESADHASGNYGLLDMVAALKWVQKNIGAFGGDPARVTIAGQSAGAASVHHLIASPLASGLFSGAIAESGSGMGIPVPERTQAEVVGGNLSHVGGDSLTLAQLRALTAADLDARVAKLVGGAPGPGPFSPVVDGLFLPNTATVGANTNDTPVLTGMTANEGTGINPNYGKITAESFKKQLDTTYGTLAADAASLYRARDDAQAIVSSDALARDRGLASMYLWAKDRFAHTKKPIYAYLWTHVEPGPDSARYQAFHSSEIPYVFSTLDKSPQRSFTAQDHALARRLGSYWVNFVKTGNPNMVGLPDWPALDAKQRQILELGAAIKPRPVLDKRRLKFFERYVAANGQLGIF
jgi:para-nitrobenzyl esterase